MVHNNEIVITPMKSCYSTGNYNTVEYKGQSIAFIAQYACILVVSAPLHFTNLYCSTAFCTSIQAKDGRMDFLQAIRISHDNRQVKCALHYSLLIVPIEIINIVFHVRSSLVIMRLLQPTQIFVPPAATEWKLYKTKIIYLLQLCKHENRCAIHIIL